MKKTLSIILSAIICVSTCTLAGCSNSYNGQITVANWGEYISMGEDDSMDVIKEFENKYNIEVNYTTYETNESLYKNLSTPGENYYDVIIPSDYMVAKLIDENMLQEINYSNIPNYDKNMMEQYKTTSFDKGNKYSVPYSWGVTALVYNKDMVKDKVTSWKSLWDKKYSKNILMFANSRDAMAIAMQMCNINPTVVTKEDIDKATEKLIEQKPILKDYVMDKVFTEMEGNQSAIAAYYAGDIATMMSNNESLAYCLPEEGSNLFIDSMCIPKTAKNKEDAEKFINFMLEADVAKANAEYIGYSTPNQAAYDLLDDDIKNNKLIYPDKEYLDKCYTFSNLPDDVYTYMQNQFTKVYGG